MAGVGHKDLMWAIIPRSRNIVLASDHTRLLSAHISQVSSVFLCSAFATGEGSDSTAEIIRFQGSLNVFPKIQGDRTG